MLLDMEQQHPASVLLSLNMSQFSSGGQQQTTLNNNGSSNNNNNSGTTNLQQLHDHSSSSPPHSQNNGGGGAAMNNSNSNNSGHFNNYVTLNNNNSQQQNYQNLYNFDTNQYIFSSTGNNNNNQPSHHAHQQQQQQQTHHQHPHHNHHHQQQSNNNSGYISLGPGGLTSGNNNGSLLAAITTTSSSSSSTSSTSMGMGSNSAMSGSGGAGLMGSNGNGTGGGMGIGGLGGSAGVLGGSSLAAELKDVIEELCPVCGDKVSGYHYGLLTCESCKGFFKRTVQNKKVYTCVAERSCHIDKTQRKRCPFCRFQKCLDVGMKLEAVRADRMRGGRNKFGPMYKRDRARKLQILRQRQIALQAIRGQINGPNVGSASLLDAAQSQLSPTGATGYPAQSHPQSQSYNSMQIKQEIQIPQVSSLTSSPDSSPSPIAIALGQVSAANGGGGNGASGGGGSNGNGTNMSIGGMNGNGSGHSFAGSSGSGTGMGGTGGSRGEGSMANQGSDSKMWYANSTTASPHSQSPKTFNFDSNPTSTADSGSVVETLSYILPRVSPMIREFVQSVDDREWQAQLFNLLQSQSYNQCEVDLFELMCKVLDQNLFSQVDWARNTIFFKDLKVDDQMKLLQHSWSDMLVLDHLHQRIHNGLPDETTLHNGQKFDLLGLGLLGVPQLAEHFNEIQTKLQELKFDVGDYICMKFLLLLNPDVRGVTNRKTILEGYENVQAALLDYTLTCYSSVSEKFSKLLSIIPEIHSMASRGEEHLYMKHCAGSAPTQTLLMEMLHAKRK